jgi:hypothetical protein
MPLHLGSGSVLTDRNGPTASHVSGLLKGVSDGQAVLRMSDELPFGEVDPAAIPAVESQADRGKGAVPDRSDIEGLPALGILYFDGER